MPYGLDNRCDRHSSSVSGGRIETSCNGFVADVWSHTIVYCHQPTFGWHDSQSVLHRMEAFLAACGNGVTDVEPILLAQLTPILLLTFGQYHDYLHCAVPLCKLADGVHQYRHSIDHKKLLRDVATHAQPLAACYYDYCVVHLQLFIAGS